MNTKIYVLVSCWHFRVEKRPWILRAKQGGVHKEGSSNWEEDQTTFPRTLIYVSCGWHAFKLV